AEQLSAEGAPQFRKRLKDAPLVRAALLDTIGAVYRSMGLFKEARPLLDEARAARRKGLGGEHLDVATSLFHLGWWHNDSGDFEKAEELYRRALAIRLKHLPADSLPVAECKFNLGWALSLSAKPEAEELFREAIAVRRKRCGDKHYEVAAAKAGLAAVLIDAGKYLEAVGPGTEALTFVMESEGKDRDSTLKAAGLFQKGMLLKGLKSYGPAEKAFR